MKAILEAIAHQIKNASGLGLSFFILFVLYGIAFIIHGGS